MVCSDEKVLEFYYRSDLRRYTLHRIKWIIPQSGQSIFSLLIVAQDIHDKLKIPVSMLLSAVLLPDEKSVCV